MDNFPSKFKTADESPGFLLWQVMHKWQRKQQAMLRELGLTHIQFVLLASLGYLGKKEATVSQADLTKLAKTDKMVTSQVTRALEKGGYVLRSPHPHDGRAHTLRLTSKGEKIVARALPRVEKVDDEFFGPLGQEVERLTQSLVRLSQTPD